jgi:hypothetical protein
LTAVAAISGKLGINEERGRFRNSHQHSAGDPVLQIGVIFDSLERLLLYALILPHERIVGPTKCVAVEVHALGKPGKVEFSDLAGRGRSGRGNRWSSERVAGGCSRWIGAGGKRNIAALGGCCSGCWLIQPL